MTAIARRATITLHASVSQRRMIERAARTACTNLSDFMLEAACEKAKQALLDHTAVVLDSTQFKHVLAPVDAPAEQDSTLRTLLLRHAPWEI